jgi:hypothetical protein
MLAACAVCDDDFALLREVVVPMQSMREQSGVERQDRLQ